MMFARQDITKLVGVALAIAALDMTIPGGRAAADATDDAFQHKLFADGIDFAQTELNLKRARGVCEAFGKGWSPAVVHEAVLHGSAAVNGSGILDGSAFSPSQAAIFMADAVQYYCPRYADLFIS